MSNWKIAVDDYRYLKNRAYPDRAALKLVGDRYGLSRLERNCLFRGIVAAPDAALRRSKLVAGRSVDGRSLGVDWYNVVITVESYLKGLPVFLADDGVARDASGVHGSYRSSGVTDRATALLLERLRLLAPNTLELFLDEPIAFSGDTARRIREQVADRDGWRATVARSPDFLLKEFGGIVASSDSVILDRAGHVVDLPRDILLDAFGFEPPPLQDLDLSDRR